MNVQYWPNYAIVDIVPSFAFDSCQLNPTQISFFPNMKKMAFILDWASLSSRKLHYN